MFNRLSFLMETLIVGSLAYIGIIFGFSQLLVMRDKANTSKQQ